MGGRIWVCLAFSAVAFGCGAQPSPSRTRDGLSSAGVEAGDSASGGVRGHPTGGGGNGGTVSGVGPPTGGVGGGIVPPMGGAIPAGAGGGAVAPGNDFDAGTAPGRNMVAAGAVCARLSQIQCAGEAACCMNPGRDRAACEAAQMASCSGKAYIDVISLDPKAGFDPAQANTAFTELERLASMCDPSIATYGASTMGFAGIFKGSRPPGSDCGTGGSLLNPPSKEQAAVALASCNTIDTTACLPSSGSNPLAAWNCSPKGGAGAPCLTDLNCQAGLGCPNPALAGGSFGLGVCTARGPMGSPCSGGTQCMSLICVAGACAPADAESAYCLAKQQ